MNRFAAMRRLLAVLLLAIWWGGFTFYALAVIPSGHQVLRSRVRQGFITQRVTEKLNWVGVVTLAVVLAEVIAARPQPNRFRVLLGAWLVCVVTQATLFYVHARMSALLDATRLAVTDDARFYFLHQCYLWPATIGWLASGLILAKTVGDVNPLGTFQDPKASEASH